MNKIYGKIIKGAGRGKQLGFPTANIAAKTPLSNKDFGVFLSYIIIERKKYGAITHIGPVKIFGVDEIKVEAHILGWSKNIYGKEVILDLIKKIRDTKDFIHVQDLIEAIKQDIKTAHLYFSTKK